MVWVLLLALHAGTGVGDVQGFDAISLVFDDYEACIAAAASMERRLIEAPVTAICVGQAAASVQAKLARKTLAPAPGLVGHGPGQNNPTCYVNDNAIRLC